MAPQFGFRCARCLILLAGSAVAQFPFVDPPPPPSRGPPAGELTIFKQPSGVEQMIESPVVSLIMFTQGDVEEATDESDWFMLFCTMVEQSIDLSQGDARVHWALASNAMLRKEGSELIRPPGIYLFCVAEDQSGTKLPMRVLSHAAVREAGTFILGALASAKAEISKGLWHKAVAKSEL